MYTFIIIIHVIACLILIIAILLQSGRGGGMSELFGSGSSQTIFGARASAFLTRATTVSAILFLLTCISLTIFSSQKVKSLMTDIQETEVVVEPVQEQAVGAVPEEAEVEKSGASETESQVPKE